MEKEIVPAVNPISREILTYLARLPHKLKQQGDSAAADIALTLGNCLLSIEPWIAPHQPKVEQPIDETPQTIHALGKQFRAVALSFMEKPSFQSGQDHWKIRILEGCIDDLNERLHKIERGEM